MAKFNPFQCSEYVPGDVDLQNLKLDSLNSMPAVCFSLKKKSYYLTLWGVSQPFLALDRYNVASSGSMGTEVAGTHHYYIHHFEHHCRSMLYTYQYHRYTHLSGKY